MDIEICKKCHKPFRLMKSFILNDDAEKVGVHFFGVCRDNGTIVVWHDFSDEESEFIKNNKLYEKIRYCYELPFVSGMKTNKNCPYYAEHNMSEWNKYEY